MITQIMAVRDSIMEAYNAPFATATVGAAIRSFTDAVNDTGKGDIAKHAKDFDLFHLGTYDDNSGKITTFDNPKHIINGEGAKNV
ncbi:MAG: nonstructural protein [Microvirus sp.]|nr:MAG: nonstructural protein [Microvirus sp.]